MKNIRLFAFTLAAIVAAAAFSIAQTSEGRILGTVVDQTGAVVGAAKVTITNTATNVSRDVETNHAGEYVASNLEPGSYVVSAEASGFKRAMSTPVLLEVARDLRVDLKLQAGAATETVTVTAEGALADTGDTALNGVLSNKAITELPVQGRDFQNLLELHPGVQRTPGGGFHSVTSNGNQGTLTGTVRADFIGGSTAGTGSVNGIPLWFNPLAFGRPLDGTTGNTGRNILRGPGTNNWDFSLFKNTNIGEHIRTQLRVESFNLFNHTQFSGVNTGINGSAPGAPITSGTQGTSGLVNGTRDPRTIQLGLKLYF